MKIAKIELLNIIIENKTKKKEAQYANPHQSRIPEYRQGRDCFSTPRLN